MVASVVIVSGKFSYVLQESKIKLKFYVLISQHY